MSLNGLTRETQILALTLISENRSPSKRLLGKRFMLPHKSENIPPIDLKILTVGEGSLLMFKGACGIGCGVSQLSVVRSLDMDLNTIAICFLLTSLLVGT